MKFRLSIREIVVRAIDEYNRYRSPEAKAKLVEVSGREIVLEFEGSFCRSCGVYDYLEDFIYELQRFADLRLKIISFEEYIHDTIRVRYIIE